MICICNLLGHFDIDDGIVCIESVYSYTIILFTTLFLLIERVVLIPKTPLFCTLMKLVRAKIFIEWYYIILTPSRPDSSLDLKFSEDVL